MKKLILLLTKVFFLSFAITTTSAQETKLDSLINLLNAPRDGLSSIELYSAIVSDLNNRSSKEVITYLNQFLSEAKELGDPFHLGRVNQEFARYYFNFNMADSAYSRMQRAISIYENTELEREKYYAYLRLSDLYINAMKMPEAEDYALRSLKYGEESKDTILMAISLNNLGILNRLNEKFELSLEAHLKAYTLIKETDDLYSICDISNNLGYIYSITFNYQEAIKYLLESIAIAEKKQLYRKLSSSYNRIALAYDYLDLNDTALLYFNKALDLNLELDNLISAAYNYHNIGVIYDKEEDYVNAEKYYIKSLNIKEKFNDMRDICSSYVQLGSVYINLNQLSKAKKYLDSAYKMARESKNLNLTQLSYQFYAEYSAAKGDYENSYYYVLKRIRTMDSLFMEINKRSVESLRIQHNTKQKEDSIKFQTAQLVISQQENELKRRQLKNRNILGIVLTIFTALLLLFYLLLRKTNKNLDKEKSRAEILLKEVQHRVKNNLLFVASLLDLQSLNLPDSAAKKVVDEGRYRIESMGLLHQKLLYKEKEPTSINMKEYFSELLKKLESAITSENNLSIHLNIEDIELDVEQAMPLGLILNELVMNSVKHVQFTEKSTRIDISLSSDNNVVLVVEDNGNGFPKDFDIKESSSFGIKLIRMLTKQLEGQLSTSNNPGARFELVFQSSN